MPGTYTRALSLAALAATKSSKRAVRDPGSSDVDQLPYCYRRPSAELAVKPIN
jgi:hypothetical protein